jgi:hypothetical protein
MNIVVRNPALVGLWRHLPASSAPDIGIAVPTMIPIYPNVIAAGRRAPSFDDRNRRPQLNYDVGSRGAKSQRARKNNSY